MNKNQEWLDPSEKHALSEQECNMISLFRTFGNSQREAIFKALFLTAMEKNKGKEK